MGDRWHFEAHQIRQLVNKALLEQAAERLGELPIREFRNMGILLQAELRQANMNAVTEPEKADRDRGRIASRLLKAVDLVEQCDDGGTTASSKISMDPSLRSISPFYASHDKSILEKIITSSQNLRDITWLASGLHASKSVCCIRTDSHSGTGFLFAPGFLMTNHHVIPSANVATDSSAHFNFQLRSDGTEEHPVVYGLNPRRFFRTSEELDYTVVAIDSPEKHPPLQEWGHLSPAPDAKVCAGDTVSIIQHPSAGFKKVAVGTNHVTGTFQHYLHYLTDTREGSSGSPVFDSHWRVLAIHHAGGEMQVNSRGDMRYVNEGVLMSFIQKDLREVWPGAMTAFDSISELK